MIQCVWRQSLRFGNRIHRLKPTECCNTLCPTKTNRQQSFSVVQLQECTHAMSSSPGNGSPFTTTSAVGEYMQGHVAPALGNASQVHCWTNCSLLFPGMTNGRGGVSLSPQLGKARGGKHRYLGISRPGSPIFQRPITAKSQQQGDPNVPKS